MAVTRKNQAAREAARAARDGRIASRAKRVLSNYARSRAVAERTGQWSYRASGNGRGDIHEGDDRREE